MRGEGLSSARLIAAIALCAAGVCAAGRAPEPLPPNVLVIVCDDFGVDAIGYQQYVALVATGLFQKFSSLFKSPVGATALCRH